MISVKRSVIYFALAFMVSSLCLHAETFTVQSGVGSVGKDAKSYTPIKTGSEYPLGWWARTTDSPLKIVFSPMNVFRLLPRSEVQITGTGGPNTRFQRYLIMKSGKIEFDLPQLNGSKVEVETPTIFCGVTGTQFTLDSDSAAFQVLKGRIYAKAKGESVFAAESVAGNFSIATGQENSYAGGIVSGTFLVNGRQFSGSDLNFEVAKSRGAAGPAAVRVISGAIGASGPGSYFMTGGALHPVDKKTAVTHGMYLIAAHDEAVLNVKRESLVASGRNVPAKLDQQLAVAVARATEIRNRLFAQRP